MTETEKTKRPQGRPAVGEVINITITSQQRAWLRGQGRPMAETIRGLITEAMEWGRE